MTQQPKPTSSVLITNASIFDGASEKLTDAMSVLVEGDKIARIAKSIPTQTADTYLTHGFTTIYKNLLH